MLGARQAGAPGEANFRWRGNDVTRIEALTDAVFAFAMTLLVVSLEVPRTYAELVAAFKLLPAFAVCFAILLWCWFEHHRFFRRYGLQDRAIVALNGVFLFLVLFYVYPLRFLFELLWRMAAGLDLSVPGPDGEPVPRIGGGDSIQELMILYGAGFAGIFLVLAALQAYAWKRRIDLDLAPLERVITKAGLHAHLLSACVGLGSIAIACLGARWAPIAGMFYAVLGPIHGLHGWTTGRAIERYRTAEDVAA